MIRETVLNNVLFNYNKSFDNVYNKLIENKDYYCKNIEIEKFKDIKMIIPIKYDIEDDKILNPQIIIFKTTNNYYVCYLNEIEENNYIYCSWYIFNCLEKELIEYFQNKIKFFDIVKEKKLLKLILIETELYFPINHTRYEFILGNIKDNFEIIEIYNNFNYYKETKSVSDSINKLFKDLDLKYDELTEKIINKFDYDGTIFTNLDN